MGRYAIAMSHVTCLTSWLQRFQRLKDRNALAGVSTRCERNSVKGPQWRWQFQQKEHQGTEDNANHHAKCRILHGTTKGHGCRKEHVKIVPYTVMYIPEWLYATRRLVLLTKSARWCNNRRGFQFNAMGVCPMIHWAIHHWSKRLVCSGVPFPWHVTPRHGKSTLEKNMSVH